MNRRFVIPSLVISALSSIGSFIASSDILDKGWRTGFTLSVGVMTSLNALIQSFSSAYQYDSKCTCHYAAAEQYEQIITEIDFEKSYPNNSEFFQELEKKLLTIKSNCQYLVLIEYAMKMKLLLAIVWYVYLPVNFSAG